MPFPSIDSAGKRRYSDDERSDALTALAANDGRIRMTARQLGIPARTLESWASGERHPEATQMSWEKKRPLAEKLEDLANRLIDHAAVRLEECKSKDAVVAAAVCIDRSQLLLSLATSNPRGTSKLDLSKLTTEELLQWQAMMKKCQRTDAGPAEANPSQDAV